MVPFFSIGDLNYSRNPDIHGMYNITFLRGSLNTPELPSGQPSTPRRPVKHLEDDWTHNLAYFPIVLMEEMQQIKQFTK